jgi:hypothetical protein
MKNNDSIIKLKRLVKLRKILNWEKINEVYASCYRSRRKNKTKTTDIDLGLILLKHLYKKNRPDPGLKAASK